MCRPISPGRTEGVDLYYVSTGRKSAHPLFIISEGGSLQRYQGAAVPDRRCRSRCQHD